ncbi:DHA1 family inner membrane transport protein [Kineococcus xinjiangensis]|uniref:DHA1 family inner membrane transport protein n=1 Tax=Kineococcus xinjiangensis TaxID=512762 RepID=A0A2S6IFB2_9ACTN|nr:MFS transporter [Kineococcus xinjiangensis]PPK92899.1 DHA1 family inner membrane transport protein [Kineococcus xinjiangensis]
MPLALLALAVGGFAIGTTEFVAMGLLPEMAATFGVSIPTAGWIITAYALGVVVGAPTLTALAHRYSRKHVLIGLMVLFTLGHVATALAPTFGLLVAARAVSALSHGAFFGASAVVARHLAPPGKQGQAMALAITGLTVANIVGVPLGTALGQQYGWRLTYAVVAGIGLLTIAALALLVPDVRTPSAGLRAELSAFSRAQVWLTMLITVIGFSGLFTVLSYIAPILTDLAGYSPGSVSWLLVLFGVGATAGNLLGGRLADWSVPRTLLLGLCAQTGVFAVFAVAGGRPVVAAAAVFAFGFAGFSMSTAIQTRAIVAAGGGASMVAAAQQAGFNIGNAMGAFLGGLVLDAGLGYRSPMVVAAGLTLTGLAVAALAGWLDRSGRAPLEPAPARPGEPAATTG